MKPASTLFNDEEKQRIDHAVADAESRTSAEIVPVVATVSGRYDRPEDTFGLWLAAASVVVVWLVLPEAPAEAGSWGGLPAWLQAVCLVAGVVVAFIVGPTVASRVGWLRRLFSPRKQMREEVEAAARGVFFDSRVHRTAGATGLLIYISLYERMAAVIADQAVTEAVGQPALDGLCRQLTRRLQSAGATEGLCETVRAAGEQLAGVLPRAEDDVNELPNGLVTID
jgi:putative membrane protein